MLKKLRRYAIWVVIASWMLSGCSWFSKDPSSATVNAMRTIDVEVIASVSVNPNSAGQAQPVKVCVIETKRPGWVPEGIRDGAPCREAQPEEGIVSRNWSILQPNETRHYRLEVPAGQERWIVIGAEFQLINGGMPLVEHKSPASVDSQIKVIVGMTSLSVVDKQQKG